MTTTTDERAALGDWAAEMMGLCDLAMDREGMEPGLWDMAGLDYPGAVAVGDHIVSWAGMGLLVAELNRRGYTVKMSVSYWGHGEVDISEGIAAKGYGVVTDGDVPLAAFQAARQALGGAK